MNKEEVKKVLEKAGRPPLGSPVSPIYDFKLGYNPDIRSFRGEWFQPSVWIDKVLKPYHVYYIHDYYTEKRCKSVDSNILTVRNLIFDFKNGKNPEVVASLVSDAIKTKEISLKDTCCVIIPASTPEKTEKRYKTFCSKVCNELGISNGLGAITTDPHTPTKGQSGGDKIKHFHFDNNYYKGKRVLLFDDVYTSGTTFYQVLTRLFETGAGFTMGVFLAKTFY